jgi:hypothetical protein
VKIGLSFSRCLREIVEGKVDINDVLVIIARTHFDPNVNEEWTSIWNGYSVSEWYGTTPEDEAKYRDLAIKLQSYGKLHQPRKFGSYRERRTETWLEAVLPSSELEKNPAAKKAWDQFQMVAGLAGVGVDYNYE